VTFYKKMPSCEVERAEAVFLKKLPCQNTRFKASFNVFISVRATISIKLQVARNPNKMAILPVVPGYVVIRCD